jgi:acyl-CoA reductase-like NAD-dependent aldehyde dehydrogenase
MSLSALPRRPDATAAEIETALAALKRGAQRLDGMSLTERQALLEDSIQGVAAESAAWVEQACAAKQIPAENPARAEEILAGPVAALRYLHLMHRTLADIQRTGRPRLPGRVFQRGGQLRVPIFPTPVLYDGPIFRPLRAETWMQQGVEEANLFGANLERMRGNSATQADVVVVLGAGNVSSIPITDALSKLFQSGQGVLLKMNPVNGYLGPIFARAFRVLVEADLLRIVQGGGEVGTQLINHEGTAEVHITGSDKTHDAIVWGASPEERARRRQAGEPLLAKRITSELGNVSPWIIAPGEYSRRELYFQAENIVASIVHNASFNCVATKMLVTCRSWPQRDDLLERIETLLERTPRRVAYYPGAVERYARFSGRVPPEGETPRLPWTLRRDLDPEREGKLFREESFVCVCGETALDADTTGEFLARAAEFVNERMWGTLSVAVTVPADFQRRKFQELDNVLRALRYGTIGVNQWPGVAFALMSPPWGGHPGATLRDVQSGIGTVHNTYLLDRPEKTVLYSPLTVWPKPMWFSTHGCPESVARRLLELYKQPSAWRLLPVFAVALRG